MSVCMRACPCVREHVRTFVRACTGTFVFEVIHARVCRPMCNLFT